MAQSWWYGASTAISLLLGGLFAAVCLGVAGPPPTAIEEQHEQERAEWERFRAELVWSEWADAGIEVRVGVPREVRIGKVFGVGMEVQAGRWLKASNSKFWSPDLEGGLSLICEQGGKDFVARQWTGLEMSDFTVPYMGGHLIDLLEERQPQRWSRKFLIPRSTEGVRPGDAWLRLVVERKQLSGGGERKWIDGRMWVGKVESDAVKVQVLAAGMQTVELSVPKVLRGEDRGSMAPYGIAGQRRRVLVFPTDAAESLEVELPTGAMTATFLEGIRAQGGPFYLETGFMLEPGFEAEVYGSGSEGKNLFRLGFRWQLPDEPHAGWRTAWEREYDVKFPEGE